MTYGMAAASGLLLCAACSEPRFSDTNRRADGGQETAEIPPDGGSDAGMAEIPRDAAVEGGPVRMSKTLRIRVDAFGDHARSCGTKLCVQGGISP